MLRDPPSTPLFPPKTDNFIYNNLHSNKLPLPEDPDCFKDKLFKKFLDT